MHFLILSFKKNDPKFEKTWDHRIPVWNGSQWYNALHFTFGSFLYKKGDILSDWVSGKLQCEAFIGPRRTSRIRSTVTADSAKI